MPVTESPSIAGSTFSSKQKYANEDGCFDYEFNYIETKRMPQPFPANHELYSLAPQFPLDYPIHRNDVRYNFDEVNWPRRHVLHERPVKL